MCFILCSFVMDVVFEKLHTSQEVSGEEWACLTCGPEQWSSSVDHGSLKRLQRVCDVGAAAMGTLGCFSLSLLGSAHLVGKLLGVQAWMQSSVQTHVCSQLQTTLEQVSQKDELKPSATAHSKLRWELLSSGLLPGCSFRPEVLADLSLSSQSDFRKKCLLPAKQC